MFRYGLIGNILTYGGTLGCFIYMGYEMNNIRSFAAECPEELAKEIFNEKSIQNMGSLSKPDVKSAAARLYLQEYQRQEYVQMRIQQQGEENPQQLQQQQFQKQIPQKQQKQKIQESDI